MATMVLTLKAPPGVESKIAPCSANSQAWSIHALLHEDILEN